MVDTRKIKSLMVLHGYTQKTLVDACKSKGYKTCQNTINAKINKRSPFDLEDVKMFCDVLEIKEPAEICSIFLM